MDLSVVVCTFNRSASLRRTLNSLLEAAAPDHLSCEFIVIDNNSDDDTRFVVEATQKRYGSIVKYIFEEKRGLSHARNRGVMEAKGRIIAFTDDDVIVDKHWIHNVEKAFKEHDDAAAVGGKLLPIWQIAKPKWLTPKLYAYVGLLDHGDSECYLPEPDIYGANFAIKANMFTKYGLFDLNLGRRGAKLYSKEESELLQRLQNAGERLLYYPLLVIYHNVPAHRISKRYFRKWAFDEGELEGILFGDARYMQLMPMHSETTARMVRNLVVSLLKISCFTNDRFDHELRISRSLGFLSGRMKRMGVEG